MQKKYISVMLSRQNSMFSKTIYWVSGRKYTHASIRLDSMGDSFFSFNINGFCEEWPKLYSSKRTTQCILYQIEVPEEVYEEVEERLNRFRENSSSYRYSRLGLLLTLMRIPHKPRGSYICSQFVAELLVHSNAIRLLNDVSVCTPNHLERALLDAASPYPSFVDTAFSPV